MISRNGFDYTKQKVGICIVYSFSKALSAITNGSVKYDAVLEEICKIMEPMITVPFNKGAIKGSPFSSHPLQDRIEILSNLVRSSKGYPYSGFDVNNTFLFVEIFPALRTALKLKQIVIVKHDNPDFDKLKKADCLYSMSFSHQGGWHEVVCGYDTDYYVVDPNFNHPFSLFDLENRYRPVNYGDCLLFSTK